jgi:hypothetical protein
MTDQEKADLVVLKAATARLEKLAFEMAREADREPPDKFPTYAARIGRPGQTKEQVIAGFVRDAWQGITRLTNAHLKKYPD